MDPTRYLSYPASGLETTTANWAMNWTDPTCPKRYCDNFLFSCFNVDICKKTRFNFRFQNLKIFFKTGSM